MAQWSELEEDTSRGQELNMPSLYVQGSFLSIAETPHPLDPM